MVVVVVLIASGYWRSPRGLLRVVRVTVGG